MSTIPTQTSQSFAGTGQNPMAAQVEANIFQADLMLKNFEHTNLEETKTVQNKTLQKLIHEASQLGLQSQEIADTHEKELQSELSSIPPTRQYKIENPSDLLRKEVHHIKHDIQVLTTTTKAQEKTITKLENLIKQKQQEHPRELMTERNWVAPHDTAGESETQQQLQSTTHQLQCVQKEQEKIQKQVEHLQKTLQKTEQAKTELTHENQQLKHTTKTNEKQINNLDRQITNLERQKESLTQEVDRLKGTNVQLRERETGLHQDIKRLEIKIKKQMKEVVNSRKTATQNGLKIQQLERKNELHQILERKNELHQIHKETRQKKYEQLQQQLNDKQKQIEIQIEQNKRRSVSPKKEQQKQIINQAVQKEVAQKKQEKQAQLQQQNQGTVNNWSSTGLEAIFSKQAKRNESKKFDLIDPSLLPNKQKLASEDNKHQEYQQKLNQYPIIQNVKAMEAQEYLNKQKAINESLLETKLAPIPDPLLTETTTQVTTNTTSTTPSSSQLNPQGGLSEDFLLGIEPKTNL